MPYILAHWHGQSCEFLSRPTGDPLLKPKRPRRTSLRVTLDQLKIHPEMLDDLMIRNCTIRDCPTFFTMAQNLAFHVPAIASVHAFRVTVEAVAHPGLSQH